MRALANLTLLSVAALILCSPATAQYRTVSNEASIDIFDGQKLVTTYHYRSGSKPILWPLMGPDDMRFSREYPMVADSKDEDHDHPHHRSIWMTFGEVNEFDLWAEGKGKGTVCQVGKPEVTADKNKVTLKANHLWKGGVPDVSSVSSKTDAGCDNSAKTLAECQATYVIHGTSEERVLDFTYDLKATVDLHFGDTKEGMFAIRVPEPMRADKRGGKILTSEGRINGDAWGFPARWVDYSGRIIASQDKNYGIAILIHPKSYNANGRWHVRTYGLFAHNPIGVKDFPKYDGTPGEKAGGHHLNAGQSMKLAYRVILHRDAFDAEAGNKRWEAYAKE
jgi:hypothetical protein